MSTTERTLSSSESNLEKHEQEIDASEAEYKFAVRRLDYVVLPLTAAIYLLNFLE